MAVQHLGDTVRTNFRNSRLGRDIPSVILVAAT